MLGTVHEIIYLNYHINMETLQTPKPPPLSLSKNSNPREKKKKKETAFK